MELSLKDRLVRYITSNVGKDLFLSVEDAIRTAYAKAHHRAVEDCKNTSPNRLRSYQRRYFVDDALAGVLAEGSPSVLQTVPKGEQYIVICAGNITLSHIELHQNQWARPARHRSMLSQKNAILEPITYDFFKAPPPKMDDALHVVAVVLHPGAAGKDQSQPTEIVITVPYTDWLGYHLEIPLKELIKEYGQEANAASMQVDLAWPMLRDDLQKEEKRSSDKSE